MILNIVTPTFKMVTDLEVSEVTIPAHRGELTILPDHAPLVSELNTGILTYKVGESKVRVAVSWGYCEVSPKGIRILAETAETKEFIDVNRAQQTLKLSEERLSSGELDPEAIAKYQRKAKRAQTRLELLN